MEGVNRRKREGEQGADEFEEERGAVGSIVARCSCRGKEECTAVFMHSRCTVAPSPTAYLTYRADKSK